MHIIVAVAVKQDMSSTLLSTTHHVLCEGGIHVYLCRATVAQASAPHCRARSMALPLFRPTRRLRGKAPPGQGPQSSLLAPLELGDEAPTDGKRQAYLVTLPRPTPGAVSNGVALVAPGSKTKEEILACVLDAFANPDYANPWQAHGPVPLSKAGVWREFHSPGPNGQRDVHDHVPAF